MKEPVVSIDLGRDQARILGELVIRQDVHGREWNTHVLLDIGFNPPTGGALVAISNRGILALHLEDEYPDLRPIFEVAFTPPVVQARDYSTEEYATLIFAVDKKGKVSCEVTSWWEGTSRMSEHSFVEQWIEKLSLELLGVYGDDVIEALFSGDCKSAVVEAEPVFKALGLWLEKTK